MGYRGGRPGAGYLPHWRYLGGENIAGDGTDQAATLPTGTQIFEIDAEGGVAYFTINGPPGAHHGFVPENGGRIVGPLVGLTGLFINCAAGVTAHVMYFREHVKRT